MYCRNCGNSIDPKCTVCMRCGFTNGTGENYCPTCGAQTNAGLSYCTVCGTNLIQQQPIASQKSKIAAGLLGIFVGGLGIHNFYLGYTTKAVIQLALTLVTCGAGGFISGIWGFVEGILILTGSINVDGKGMPLRD